MPEEENTAPQPTNTSRSRTQGSNAQRGPPTAGATTGKPRRRGKGATQQALELELEKTKALLLQAQADKEKLEQAGRAQAGAAEEDVLRLDRPKGEAGDRVKGFNLQDAMGLADNNELYDKILRSVRQNVVRVNLDFTADYRNQDAAKIANVFKLTRMAEPYLTRKRFPLDWSTAEMIKQYLRNKRRNEVHTGRMPNRAARKRAAGSGGDDTESSQGSNKRRKTNTVRHIDQDNGEASDSGDGNVDGDVDGDE
ncbi:hypothetical protein C8J57DRAFT_1479121 [Mycena rebaudengoi]|nr:hypothetical protein C8J57DRAFT_1479121 [Mycena rebaudengoi]